jgi:glycine/D-amino acid oxidase-like deaminating enzyme
VVGAGIVGAACAHYLAQAGLSVLVIDGVGIAGGSTSAGEGNILLSDKLPGPELELALLSNHLWRALQSDLGEHIELESKGGLVVAQTAEQLAALRDQARRQRDAGVDAVPVDDVEVAELEPRLRAGLLGGVFYPGDMQVQPMLATAHLLRARGSSCRLRVVTGCRVEGIELDRNGSVESVQTSQGRISTSVVVNAAGVGAGEVARMGGVHLPIAPRRGFILVTEPLPHVINHKVYSTDYVGSVASDSALLQTATVVEGTKAGTVLIGASRERVGLDTKVDWKIIERLARQAIAAFPFLARVELIRVYSGFRPYCPDHLPVIGADTRVGGLIHACGHEGAGIGLSLATGELVSQAVLGIPYSIDVAPFRATRFSSSESN